MITEWQKCPVCEGRGLVPVGFYNAYPYTTTGGQTTETCRTCQGKTIILKCEVVTWKDIPVGISDPQK
jgi:C4-type Zn-finger protein